MIDVMNQASFLRTSRAFPETPKELSVEVNRTYIDIARNVNTRVIGFFILNRSTVTGESWFITQNKRQQGLREVYRFDDANLIITHGIQFASLTNFIRIWGTFFDGTSWQTLPYVDVVSVTNQINVRVTSTQIIITKGAGAPAIQNGLVVLEWLANP